MSIIREFITLKANRTLSSFYHHLNYDILDLNNCHQVSGYLKIKYLSKLK